MTPEQISQLRATLGESQVRFGMRFNVTGVTVYRWENGVNTPDAKTMPKIIKLKEKTK